MLFLLRGLTYRVHSDTRREVQVFLAMCIPHPDTLSVGEHNVWSHVGLQHIPAEQGMALQSWTRSQTTFAASTVFSDFFSLSIMSFVKAAGSLTSRLVLTALAAG